VVLNFDNADIETVIHAASEIAGFNYVLAPDVRGKVTVQTSGRIPQEDVFGVLLAILEVHGFTAVKAGNLYKILRIEGARERAVPTIIGPSPDPQRLASDEIITQIVPLRFGSVTDLTNLIRPLISTRGALIAHRETNILIITDTASNVRRLLDIVRLVDVEVALEEVQILPVRFADAADLEAILNRLFQSGRLRAAAPGVPAPPAPPATPGAPRPPAAAPGETTGVDRVPLIVAVRRSNSLVVHGRRHELEIIKRLVAQLDVNIYGGRRVFIYYAENAKSKDLAATLNAIYGGKDTVTTTATTPTTPRRAGEPPPPPPPAPTAAPGASLPGGPPGGGLEGDVRFIADETTNAIIVTTFPHNWPEIEATIKQLDKMPRQVLIEVLVAEISLTEDISLGLDWALRTGRLAIASSRGDRIERPRITPGRVRPTGEGLARALLIGSGLASGGLTAFTLGTEDFFAVLNFLASDSRLNVLSHPHVMTAENKKAVINVSRSVPIVTSQQTPLGGVTTPTDDGTATTTVVGTQTVEYRDAGVILTVTPRIGEQGTVALDVKQEVNEVGAPVPPTGSPQFIKREAETSVVLVNNQTLVLGGLIQDRRSNERRGIPWLRDVPILGYLFGATDRMVEKTELILMITPRVLGTALDAARITDQMRRTTPELDEAIRRSPRPPTQAPPPPPSPGATPPSPGVVVPVPPAPPAPPPPTR
jgi:general secretion pathway protein D